MGRAPIDISLEGVVFADTPCPAPDAKRRARSGIDIPLDGEAGTALRRSEPSRIDISLEGVGRSTIDVPLDEGRPGRGGAHICQRELDFVNRHHAQVKRACQEPTGEER